MKAKKGTPNAPLDPQKGWMKHAGNGIELAGTTLGVAAIGYLADWYLENKTLYATAFAAMIGFAFAMFRFIQNASR